MTENIAIFIVMVCVGVVIGFAYVLGQASIVRDCRAVGVFHDNSEVFDCKVREAK